MTEQPQPDIAARAHELHTTLRDEADRREPAPVVQPQPETAAWACSCGDHGNDWIDNTEGVVKCLRCGDILPLPAPVATPTDWTDPQSLSVSAKLAAAVTPTGWEDEELLPENVAPVGLRDMSVISDRLLACERMVWSGRAGTPKALCESLRALADEIQFGPASVTPTTEGTDR